MPPDAPEPLVRRVFALLGQGKMTDRAARLAVYEFITWRRVTSTNDLSAIDLRAIAHTLEYWQQCDELEYRCRRIAESIQQPKETG